MPNWLYIVAHTLYLLPLTIWIGGPIILGALVAPALFRSLPRHQAGSIFGPVLRKFSRLRLGAVIVLIVAAAWKFVQWESHAAVPWITIRWTAIALMAAIVLYELFGLEPAMAKTRPAADAPDDDANRLAFMRLHKRSEALMKVGLAAAFVALLLS
jgi:uncharacterized membrane protein